MEQPNLNYIKELSGGDIDFKKKLIEVVKTELPLEIEEYLTNIERSAYIKAAENVHKLKHKLGILGLEEGYAIAIAYETQLREGTTDLKNTFQSILSACTNFISGL